jgi:Zn-dependent protease
VALTEAQRMILSIPAVLIGFAFHEFAHAWVATKFGDDTPRLQGRLTLDPRAHIDWLGFLLVVVGGFGWAKPVLVNTEKLRPRILGDICVSLAGVAMNFLIAVLFGLISLGSVWWEANQVVTQAFLYIAHLNLWLVAFNVLPIPPLDGFHVAKYLIPRAQRQIVPVLYQYGPMLLLLLILTRQTDKLLGPIMSGVLMAWSWVITPFVPLFG